MLEKISGRLGTYIMLAGSFRLLIMEPLCHFSFLTLENWVLIRENPACRGRTSHQGQSVSIIRRSLGIVFKTSKFSSVFNELKSIDSTRKSGQDI